MSDAAGPIMDRMYRHQRHIYDVSRSCYLLGRDRLIAELDPAPNATVLEIGCGTGRNLIHTARRYPGVRCFGIDASGEMLATAGTSIANAGLSPRVRIARADATQLDLSRQFGHRDFDRVILSFVLSMVPSWEFVVAAALGAVAPGGSLHIVDFGTFTGLPAPARAALNGWLRMFHTVPRGDLAMVLSVRAAEHGARVRFQELYAAYSQYAVVTMPRRDGRAQLAAPPGSKPVG